MDLYLLPLYFNLFNEFLTFPTLIASDLYLSKQAGLFLLTKLIKAKNNNL